jgi:hypothetical protein
VSGQCVGAQIADPNACSGGAGCGESTLGPPGASGADAGVDAGVAGDAAPDAGTDASVVTAAYNDMTQAANWSTFDTTTLNAKPSGFAGATFDGRYVYLVPRNVSAIPDGTVARFDAQAGFTAGARVRRST